MPVLRVLDEKGFTGPGTVGLRYRGEADLE